ncbi:uncharacterized protein [Haliotis cracherodii]|uniref:uncharacterized protein n=1 Tax=Haliotis cracherodii TaxID=6455 RepID=UPI0039EC9BCA
MEHQAFRKLGSPSLYDCASECLASSVCLSFGFEHKTRTCLLNRNSSARVSISPRSGFDFCDIQHWPKTLAGPCLGMSCPLTTSCQVDRHGRASCVSEFRGCGHPPDVPGASVTHDGLYQGAVARYSCKKDYIVCHQRNTSVCQASGQWENVESLCGKFRWRNPSLYNLYDLPCGPQSKFNVVVLATPTTASRCSVALNSGEDVTLLSEFRFYFGLKKNVTVINSKLHHRWGIEVIRPLPLTVGKESEIQISLYHGEYKLVVDGVVVINFPERLPGKQPNRIHLKYDFIVRLMEISI